MSDVQEPPEDEPMTLGADPLSRWERISAGFAGIALAGGGGVAVYVSNNQAGTVALLLGGVVFLLMAVNGAPLVRARYQDYELTMARRRREAVERVDTDSPEAAQQALDVLQTVDPASRRDPAVARVSAATYERQVLNRLHEIFVDGDVRREPYDAGPDALLSTSGTTIAIELSYGQRPLAVADLRRMLSRMVSGGAVPILVITNRGLPAQVERRLRELRADGFPPTVVVRWLDHQDDSAIVRAVETLRRYTAGGSEPERPQP